MPVKHNRSTADVASLFPSSIAAGSAARRRRRARVLGLLALVAIVGVGAGLAIRASQSGSPSYRTADVSTRNVDTVLNGVATIEPVAQAKVAFPVAGTVATVDVANGAAVTVGQVLATLDTAALTVTLHEKQAALDQANLLLNKALAGESVAKPGGTNAQGLAFSIPAAADDNQTVAATFLDVSTSDIAAAQQAVLAAQRRVDAARSDASTALGSATTVCAAVGVDATDPDSATTSITACQTALHAVLTAQGDVNEGQSTLAQAASALDALLDQRAAEPPPTTTTTTVPETTTTTTVPETTTTTAPQTTTTAPDTTTTPTTSTTAPAPTTTSTAPGTRSGSTPADAGSTPTDSTPSGSSGSSARTGGGTASARTGSASASARTGTGTGSSGTGSGTGTGGGATSTTSSPSAADLVAYQSAVDAAMADVTVAEQAIAQATIVSPVAGTVVAVNLAAGDAATAASTTQTVVIEGAGGFEATTTVSLNHIAAVKVGQQASVVPDGSADAVTGSVVAISAVPTATSSTTSYGVVVSLPPDATGLGNGAIGSIAIVTGNRAGTLAVPTSAVTTTGTIHTVNVVDGSTTRRVVVGVGVVGDTWTEITTGLTAGEEVVLATVGEALPSAATAATAASAATTQRFPAGGFVGGAPPAGAPTAVRP